jgi:hypothetical protein
MNIPPASLDATISPNLLMHEAGVAPLDQSLSLCLTVCIHASIVPSSVVHRINSSIQPNRNISSNPRRQVYLRLQVQLDTDQQCGVLGLA